MNKKTMKQCVGKGWSGLIDEYWSFKKGKDIEVYSIKEKYGVLQIDACGKDCDDKFWDFIIELTHKSATVCEMCGKPGELRTDRPWYLTLCDEHANTKTFRTFPE